jgi:hypothetical protein
MHELGADRLGVDEDVLGLGAHAEGVHVWVLQQEQVLISPGLAQCLLEDMRVPVADAPQPT